MTRPVVGGMARNGVFCMLAGLVCAGIALAGEPVPVQPTEEWLERLNNMEYAVLDENGTARGDVYTGIRYHVEYYGLREDGQPATVTINVIRSGYQ